MELQRYKNADLNPQQSTFTTSGTQALSGTATQNINTLGERLAQFSAQSFSIAAEKAQDDAVNQAARDDVNGADFHKESVYTIYGKAYNNARSASYTANAEVSLSQASIQFAEEFKNDPQGYREAFKTFTSTLANDAPDPAIKGAISISGRKIANNTFGKLTIAQNENIRQSQVADYEEYTRNAMGQLINAQSIGDSKTSDLLLSNWETYSSTLIKDGIITEAGYKALKDEGQYQVKKGVLEKHLQDLLNDGQVDRAGKLVSDFNEKIPEDLGPKQYDGIQSSLNRIFNTHIKNQNALNKEQQKENENKLKDGIKIMDSTIKVPDNINELNNIVEAMPDGDVKTDFLISKQAQSILSKFSDLTLAEQENALATYKSDPTANMVDKKVLAKVDTLLSQKKSLAKTDPITLSIQEGTNQATMPLQIGMKPEDFVATMQQRAQMSKHNVEIYGKAANNLFTESEAASFSAWLEDSNTSINDKLNFIQGLESTIPGSTSTVYKQLAEKGAPVFAYVGGLIQNGKKETASKVLRGQQILKEVPQIVDYEALNYLIRARVGNALSLAGTGQREAIYKSATALYAYTAEAEGKKSGLSDSDIKKNIDELTNGVHERNGQNFFLPNNKTASDVDNYIDDITIDKLPEFNGITKDQGLRAIEEGQLISVGVGKYIVKYKNGVLATKDGNKYIMEIR